VALGNNKNMAMRNQLILKTGVWTFTVFFLIGCSISLISKYDEVIDHGITDFQKKMDLHFIQKQRNPTSPFSEGFFDSVMIDLRLLEKRASFAPKDSETTISIRSLIDQVKTIESIETDNREKSKFYERSQTTIDRDCNEILKLELAKKRGE
jgi:hypothetical protein